MTIFSSKGKRGGLKKKLRKACFLASKTEEKGVIVVTVIIKPQTHKIHKLDWGGFGNAVYQRCRLF